LEQLDQRYGARWLRAPRLLDTDACKGYRATIGASTAGGWSMQHLDLAVFVLDLLGNPEYIKTMGVSFTTKLKLTRQ
jgi:hypothetical protein